MADSYLEALDEITKQPQNPTPFLSQSKATPATAAAPRKPRKKFDSYRDALAEVVAEQPKPIPQNPQTGGPDNKLLNAAEPVVNFIDKWLVKPFDRMSQYGAAKVGELGNYQPDFSEAGVPLPSKTQPHVGSRTPEEQAAMAADPGVGVQRAIGETVGGVAADPRNLPFLATGALKPIAQKAVAGGFAALMAKSSIEGAEQVGEALDNPYVSDAEKARLVTHTVVPAVMAGLSGAHAVSPKAKVPPVEAAVPAEAPAPELSPEIAQRAAARAAQLRAEQQAVPQQGEPALDAQVRGAGPEQPVQPVENQVPPEQRASTQIAESQRAAEEARLQGRNQAKSELEQPPQPEAEKPVAESPHPNYEQIGIDADTRQPILKPKEEPAAAAAPIPETPNAPQLPQEALGGVEKAKPQTLSQGQQLPPKALEGQASESLPGAATQPFASGAEPKPPFSHAERAAQALAQSDLVDIDSRNSVAQGRKEVFRTPHPSNGDVVVNWEVREHPGITLSSFARDVDTPLKAAKLTIEKLKSKNLSVPEYLYKKAGNRKGEGQLSLEYGSENKVFTKEKAEAAQKRFSAKTGKLSSGIDPTALPDLIEVGGYHFEAGARNFAKWSQEMVKQLGESIKPHLQRIWDSVRERFGEKVPSFYSTSERTIQAKMPNAASGEQVLGILRNEVSPEELKWSGIEDFLKTKPKFTKQEVQEFIRENDVKVKEVVKGEKQPKALTWKQSESAYGKRMWQSNRRSVYIVESNDHFVLNTPDSQFPYKTLEEAQRVGGEFAHEHTKASQATKFQSYQLPGGENYRELLLTLPDAGKQAGKWEYVLPDGTRKIAFSEADAKAQAAKAGGTVRERPEEFKGGHFDEPNVLAHVRFNDRVDASGKKTLFIEEIQSDWHQKGKRHGYDDPAQRAALEKQISELDQRWQELSNKGKAASSQEKLEAVDLLNKISDLNRTYNKSHAGVPDAPFKSTWHELALKRMLRWAAENGYDKLAWTTGEQQAGRYDLSKHIDAVEWIENLDGKFHIYAKKGNETVLSKAGLAATELPDFIGKEVAEKIVRHEGAPQVAGKTPGIKAEGVLSGIDLKVGGEGMKGFYDKMLPEFLNKYAKKWGAGVGKAQVSTKFFTSREGERLDVGQPDSIHSLDITPAMRADLLTTGQPLFGNKNIAPAEFGVKNLTPAERAKLDAARQRFNDKVTRSSAGVDPTAVADLLEIGYWHFKSGAKTFAQWSKAMIQEIGDEIKPHLKSLWEQLQTKVAKGNTLVAEESKQKQGVPFLSKQTEAKPAAAPPGEKPPKVASSASATPEPEKFAGNINLEKLDTPQQVIGVLKQTAKDFAPEIEQSRRGEISNKETKAKAKQLVEDGLFTEKDLANMKRGSALNAEQLNAARGILLDISGEVAKAAKEYAKNDSSENLLKLEATKYRQIAVQRSLSGVTAEAGRALQSFKIIAKALREKNLSNYQKVLDELGGKEVTEAVAKSLAQIPENDVVSLNRFLRNHAKFTKMDKVYAYYIANILSGRAQPRNFIGNQIFGIIQPAIRAMAGIVDRPLSKVLGRERQVYAREAIPATLAYFGGIPEGFRKAAHIIKHGFDLEMANRLQIPSNYEFPGGVKNPWNHPGRWLLAADAISKTMHLNAEITALATRQAIREGLSGGRLADRVGEILKNPSPEMMDKATEYSHWATFTGKPDAISRSLLKARREIAGAKFITPFLLTPYNILKTGYVELSPLGLSRLASKEVRASGESSLIVAKAVVGAQVMTVAAILAYNNKLTGAAPSDAANRDAYYRAGKQPFSVKVGNRWVAYNQMLGPLAPHFATVAAMNDAFRETGEIPTEERLAKAAGAIGKSALDASFFKGLSDLLEGINDPQKGLGNVVTNFAQGMVPFSGLTRVVAESQDPTFREQKTLEDKIKSGIPFLSQTAPAKLDTRGREIQRKGGEGLLAFSPSRLPKDEPVDSVDAELTKLGITLSRAGGVITIKNQRYDLSDDQRRDLQKAEGEHISARLQRLFSSTIYQGMTDERKEKAAASVIREARDSARSRFIRDLRQKKVPLTPKVKTQPYFLGARQE